MENYNFAPVGPYCLKERAELVSKTYGGKVIDRGTMQFGSGYYIVPLDYEV